MNDMRRLMNLMEDSGVRYDPLPGDDEPLNKEVYDAGSVKVIIDHGSNEVTIRHGYAENLHLTISEFEDFVAMLRGQGLGDLD